MATILDFRQASQAQRQQPGRSNGRPAEIVIFPGVRYERWTEADRHQDAPNARAERDILKLAE